jgi:hypothetical protein
MVVLEEMVLDMAVVDMVVVDMVLDMVDEDWDKERNQ